MDFIREWFDNLQSTTGILWKKTIITSGKCSKHTGPGIWFASVTLDFSQSNEFVVEDVLNSNLKKIIRDRNWYQYIIFGVLDVMLTTSTSPIRNFKVTINSIEFDEIESTPMAFRLAARDAALKAVKEHFPI